jgi:ABC-type amino acid transport substrate-binding protein
LDIQKSYLVNKKNNTNQSDPNFKYLNKRIKNLSNKRVDFYLRNNINREVKVEIDYFLKFLMNGHTGIVSDKEDKKLYTLKDLYIFKNIFKSTTSIIDNIGCCLLIESPK